MRSGRSSRCRPARLPARRVVAGLLPAQRVAGLLRVGLVVAGLGLVAVATAVRSPEAWAHERRDVGPVQLVVGWAEEPPFVGVLNAVQVRVMRGGAPVGGLALKVEVVFGDRTLGPLDLEGVFGSPGEYRAVVMPTVPGAYAFHITGEVGGQRIDQRFQPGPQTFDEVKGLDEVQFPQKAPTAVEVAQSLRRLGARLDEARQASSSASARAALALGLGSGGLLLGVLALAVAALRGRRGGG